jgi:archaeosine synthase alpha-subunit
MTKYYEVLRRDGPARMGRLLIEKPIETPGLISREDYVSAGSIFGFGSVEEAMDYAMALAASSTSKLFIGPHVPSSIHSEPPCRTPEMEVEGPKGAVIHPISDEEIERSDLYILAGAGALKNPRDLVSALVRSRTRVPSDTALYTPALATPSNLALLVYLGVDLVDSTRVVADAYSNIYHTRDGMRQISDTSELPCRCQFCTALADGSGNKSALLAGHNALKLEEETIRVRDFIKSEKMREYIERQVRVEPNQTAALRLLDHEHSYLEARTPQFRHSTFYANTSESLNRVEVTRFARRVLERYTAPETDVLLLLPCSARKPYSKSKSHRLFEMAIGPARRRLNELILTSPLALVPRELEEVYPAASYDVPVTSHWDLEERAWLLRCLDAYLAKNKYTRIIAHIDGDLRETIESHGIDAVYTGGGTKDAALESLSQAVNDATRNSDRLGDFRFLRLKAVADYYFGSGAGEALLAGKVKIRGHEFQDERGRTLVKINPNGMIALSIDGARRLEPRGSYIVEIGDFSPKGSLLAPGVIGADEQIRPGDEVIVRGPRTFGVGRAKMSGWEMIESKRGVAVDLRQTIKPPA